MLRHMAPPRARDGSARIGCPRHDYRSRGQPAHLPGPHLRLPDERARLRADLRPARGRRLRPRGRRPTTPTWSSSTPARCGRTPTTGSTATSATCARSRLGNPGMQIAVGGCLAQKDRGEIVAPGALGRRGLRHPQHRLAAGAAGAGPAQRGGRGGDPRVAGGLPVDAADPARVDVRRLGVDLGRLQQHLHVLHRAVAARQGEGPPPRRRSWPRSRRWSPRACSRSPCSGRTSTPTASSSATGTPSASCCGPAATIDGLERVRFTSPHPKDFTDDVIAAMAETPNVCHSAAHAAAVRLRRGAARDAPLLPARALPRHHRQGPRGDAGRGDHHRHHRRLPRRDRGRLRAAPSTWSAQARFASAFTFQYSKRPGTPAATMDDQVPKAGRAGAVRAADRRRRGDHLGGEQAAGRRRPSRCWSPSARAARTTRTGRHVRPGPRRPAGALRRAGDDRAIRPGDIVTTDVTYAAPHHLNADGAPLAPPPYPRRRRVRGRPDTAYARGAARPADRRRAGPTAAVPRRLPADAAGRPDRAAA